MRIGVKYCGGCNPRYDRVAFVKKLENDFPEHRFTSAQEGDADLILVVCGCKAACAGHRGLSGRYGKWIVTGEEDCKAFKTYLREWPGNDRKSCLER